MIVKFNDAHIEEIVDRLLCAAEQENLDVEDLREDYNLYGEENAIQDDMNYDLLKGMVGDILGKFEEEGYKVSEQKGYWEITKGK